ncbi:MAG: general secretion pathway protein GspB [Pseudomonadota bacterium]
MSYILDALRRAEAERGRGAVPGIHTQAMPTTGMPAERPGSGNVLVIGAAVVAVAALAAGGTWWAMQRPAATPAGNGGGVAVAPPVTPVPTPAPAPMLPPIVAAPAPAPAVATVAATPAPAINQPLVPSTAEPRPVAPKRVAEPVREKPARETEAVRREAVAPATAAVPAATAAPAAPPNSPVFAQNELPPSVREQLPVLQVTGATYSSNPAHRMAIVNGQVLQEGDQAAPGLKLERIEQGRTVWSFRGYRYAVAPQ